MDDNLELVLSRDGSRAYKIGQKLGQGSFGAVYEVEVLNNQVFDEFKNPVESAVLKLALGNQNREQEKINASALLNEFRAYKSSNRSIVKMLDFGELKSASGRKLPYLILEKLQPHPFEKFNFGGDRKVDLATAINTYVNLLSSLNEIHTRKTNPLILCDIKPENIMLRMSSSAGKIGTEEYLLRISSGAYEPVFMDVGCAMSRKKLDESGGKFDGLIGSPLYLPPEAIPKFEGERVSQGFYYSTTDVYALTLTFYQYLTGEKPYSHISWVWEGKFHNATFLNILECKYSKVPPFDAEKLYSAFDGAIAKDLDAILHAGLNSSPKKRATSKALFRLCKNKFKLNKRRIRSVGTYFFDGVRGIDWNQTRFPMIKRGKNQYTIRAKRHASERFKRN